MLQVRLSPGVRTQNQIHPPPAAPGVQSEDSQSTEVSPAVEFDFCCEAVSLSAAAQRNMSRGGWECVCVCVWSLKEHSWLLDG